jgi:hypothetical protein
VIRVRCQRFILVLLMLLFGLQGLVSANSSCHHEASPSQAAEHVMPSHMADHSQHSEIASSADMATTPDCCPDCDCSLGGCSNLAILSVSQILVSSDIVLPTSRFNERFEDLLALSFFRPPVSC